MLLTLAEAVHMLADAYLTAFDVRVLTLMKPPSGLARL